MEPFSKTFNIDTRRLRVLREMRERGTVTATAEALNLTPSAISQQITALSREVGAPLLTPQGRGVRLTPQAILLLEHALAIEAQLERARSDLAAFNEGIVGHVVLGTFATAITSLVAPALVLLRRDRPRLEVSVRAVKPPLCFTHLDSGALDVVIALDYPNGPHRNDPRYSRRDLLRDPFLVAIPIDHSMASRTSLELGELADQPWILGGSGGPCGETSLAACIAAGFNPDIRHYMDDWNATLALVDIGCGVALVPRLAVPTILPQGVLLKPIAGDQRPSRCIYAAIRTGAEEFPSLAPVLDAIRQAAGDRFPENHI